MSQTISETNKIIKSLQRTILNLEKRVADLENPSKPKLISYTITHAGVMKHLKDMTRPLILKN